MAFVRSRRFLLPLILALAAGLVVVVLAPVLAPGSGAASFFDDLFKVYTPRRVCMNHEGPVIWLHLVSDSLIALAYFSIPLALIQFVRRRGDVAFDGIFWMFAAFITACGTTHLVGVWNLWQPLYRVDGIIKALTAVVSVATAAMLWPLLPKALALPSAVQLEERVERRTRDLAQANEALRAEAEARRQAEAERERLIESERAARADAERSNRAKDEFLATLSHELRTPIHAVTGWCQLLELDRSPERLEEGLRVIERNARAQSRLIDDLLDLNRIMAGRLRLEMKVVDLRWLARNAADSILPMAETKGVGLRIELADVGDIRADPERLQQVLWNLLANAVKFTPRGGEVRLSLERAVDEVRIVVADDGQGIDATLLSRIFDRFQQGGASAERHGGLGLGLAIVRHLVELHGGRVRAESEGEGRGSTFVVTLPVDQLREESAEGADSTHWGSITGLRVLVVEDDRDARELLERFLTDAGARVVTCASAEEGMALMREFRPHVLLSDLGLPDEDGFSFVRRVRSLPASEGGRTPAVAVTAFAREDDRRRALLAGFQAHVRKPVAPAELMAVIAGLAAVYDADDAGS